jgi:hypothetical protein
MNAPVLPPKDVPLKGVRSNLVQSIRAFHVHELHDAAQELDRKSVV